MNEQIEKLAEQCYETGPIGRDGWPEYSKLNYKKFGELIVRECLNQCYNRGMNDELYNGQLKAAAYIEQHFGVEE
jgi:hypothetical protein